MSDFLWKISFFKSLKNHRKMIEYNHSKGNEKIPKNKFQKTENYSKITDFQSTKKPLKVIEYN